MPRIVKGLAVLLILLPQVAQAQIPAADDAVIVGTLRVPPFAMRGDDGVWHGLSIDLWQQVAARADVTFTYRDFDYDPVGLLRALERGDIDVAVANLAITPQDEVRVDFSHAYHRDGVGIMVRQKPSTGLAGFFANLPWLRILGSVAALLSVLALVGTLMWAAERRHNAAQFSPGALRGVADGLWWAAVTMTTTGYGDKAPVTLLGRALGLLWMFTSIFTIAAFSATLASSFVLSNLRTGITGPQDLPGARIGYVTGTAGARWAKDHRLPGTAYGFVIQAAKALQRGEVDALIYERSILGHLITDSGLQGLQVLPQSLDVIDYGFAFSPGNPLREAVNRAVLDATQSDDWQQRLTQFLGEGAAN